MSKRMAAHKKSRGGCKRCKQRKVKCNESRPVCNNCYRHGTACEYATDLELQGNTISFGVSSPATQLHDKTHATDFANSDNTSMIAGTERRQLELQLMHHFVTVVGMTFPSSSVQLAAGLWTIDAVRLAFQHDFLLNAILAIAALHLLRGLPDSPRFMDDVPSQTATLTTPGVDLDSAQLVKVHSFYLDLAVKQQRMAVAMIVRENANALVFASVLISYQGLKLLPTEPGAVIDPYIPPVQWLRMVKGISDVSSVAGRIGVPTPVIPYMLRVAGEPDFADHAAFFDPANCERFRYLLDFKNNFGSEDDFESREAYGKAVAYIGRLARAIDSKELPRVIFRFVLGFAILTPANFTNCVELGRPRALIILAHYFALAKAVDDHWIFAGLAEREVAGIRGLLPPSLHHFLDWPTRIMSSFHPASMSVVPVSS